MNILCFFPTLLIAEECYVIVFFPKIIFHSSSKILRYLIILIVLNYVAKMKSIDKDGGLGRRGWNFVLVEFSLWIICVTCLCF